MRMNKMPESCLFESFLEKYYFWNRKLGAITIVYSLTAMKCR